MNNTFCKQLTKEYVKMPPLAGNTATAFGQAIVDFSPQTHKMLDKH